MKFVLVNAGEKAEVVELPNEEKIDYKKIKEYLKIDSPVTCVERKICDNYYDIWVDDEGLFKENLIIAGVLVDKDSSEMLFGNLLILSHDEEGNSIGLTEDQIKEVLSPLGITNTDGFLKFRGEDINKNVILPDYWDGKAAILKKHSDFLMYKL